MDTVFATTPEDTKHEVECNEAFKWHSGVQSGIPALNIDSKWFKVVPQGSRMLVYRDERGLSPTLSKLLAVSFFASFFGCLSEPHFFAK